MRVYVDGPQPSSHRGIRVDQFVCLGDIGRRLVDSRRLSLEGLDSLQLCIWANDIEEGAVPGDEIHRLDLCECILNTLVGRFELVELRRWNSVS